MKKVGFVSIVGKTNAGKSTLLNLIMGQKVSIATSKPQTTRNSIQGIYNDEDSQIIFVDTPGLVKTHQKLDRYMNKQISYSLIDIDALIILVDAGVPFNEEKDMILKDRFTNDVPTFVVFNKIDLTNIYLIQNLKAKYKEMFPNAEIIEISCKKEFNIEEVISKVKNVLPEGEKYYPEEMVSNHPMSFLVGEIIREKILLLTHEEVPHCVAVKVDSMKRINQTLHIDTTILVEKQSQKKIVVGKGGQMIKKIGMEARKELEKLMERKINLSTFVRVEERWRDSDLYLKEFGYSLSNNDDE
jgi:GTP-binding protein Era